MTICRDRVAEAWDGRTRFRGDGQWPVRADERTLDEPERWAQSACVLWRASEDTLSRSFGQVKANHPKVPDFEHAPSAGWSRQAVRELQPGVDWCGTKQDGGPRRLEGVLVERHAVSIGFDLVRDPHNLLPPPNESQVSITIPHQAAMVLRDKRSKATLKGIREKDGRQRRRLKARIERAPPPLPVVPS